MMLSICRNRLVTMASATILVLHRPWSSPSSAATDLA